ncbi:MAG TPA: protocatechuate 3,4-dioxygenase [Burkholderiales bacterium]|nr:protocatechuate 3,4-dioxygenase [Burkholderiales bacterium]
MRDAAASIQREIEPSTLAGRIAACDANIKTLQRAIRAARLDAIVIVGDDQREQYFEDNMPAFLVYCGETIRNQPLPADDGSPAYWRRARSQYHEAELARDYPVDAALARHMVEHLVAHDFDVSYSDALSRERGEGHAFGFVHRRLLDGETLPIVPVVVNTYYPPNQPRPARCYRFGQALRKAIESWPQQQRVGVIASGGLSHFTIDEELDRLVLDSMRNRDENALASIAPAKLNNGSSEIRNWIVTAGAAECLDPQWQEYVPFYRSPAGTGCGMAFAVWG